MIARHSLIGRDRDLTRLRDLLDASERILTLLGPPGVGKTALALALADAMPTDSTVVCDLSGVRAEEELEPAVARTLDRTSEAARGVVELLLDRGPCLIVLDNFEQIISAGHRLGSWLRDAPGARVVVTSRERLAIPGERVFEVRPLEVPEVGAGDPAFERCAAVQLFRARTREAGGEGADEPGALAEVVRALDGIPLAIELAAARRRIFSCRELAARLVDLQDALGWEQRLPDRHRSLDRAIAWSWGLLNEIEQRVLASCSVFASTFRAEEVVTLLAPEFGDEGLLDTLLSLRDKSLLFGTQDGCLGMYASIRAFGTRALSELGTEFERGIRRHHAEMMGALAEAYVGATLDLSHDASPELMRRAARHRDDTMAALAFASEHGANDLRLDLACAAAILPALSASAARHALEGALAGAAPDRAALAVLALHRVGAMRGDPGSLEGLDRVADDVRVRSTLRESALLVAGVQRRADGDPIAALKTHDRLAALEGGHARIRAINVACRGRLLGDLERFDDAIATNEEAVAACEALEQWWLAALALANLAQIEQEKGHFERADALLRRAMDRFREADQGRYEGVYSAVHGSLHLERGEHEEACRWYAAGEGFLDKMLSTYPTLVLYGGRAMAEALSGRPIAADAYLERARRALSRVPGPVGEALVRAQAAVVTLALGRGSAEQTARWRAWLSAVRGPPDAEPTVAANLDVRAALRMLTAMLDAEAAVDLVIEDDGRRLCVGGREHVELGRRATLSRIVVALAQQHAEHPGVPLSADTLFERGWPAQTILPEAASKRLRVAISTLRKMGLRPVLLTRDNGYLFDPEVRVELRTQP